MRLVTCKNLQGYNGSSEYVASETLVRLPSAVTYAWFSKAHLVIEQLLLQLFPFSLLSLVLDLFLYQPD